MPVVIHRQGQSREEGIIRVGDSISGKTKDGKEYRRPVSLGVFRLTSQNKSILEHAATVFGGTVVWSEHLQAWDLKTERTQLKAYISLKPMDPDEPGGDLQSISQWFEEYKARKCIKRCDGVTCQVWKGEDRVDVPCSCDPRDRKCKLTSRVRVVLPEIVSDGLWRLNTGSRIFDSEFYGFIDQMKDYGLGEGVIPVVLTYTFVRKATAPGVEGEKFPVVRVSIDPEPVSLPTLIDNLRRKVLAPVEGGYGDRGALAQSSAPALEHNPVHSSPEAPESQSAVLPHGATEEPPAIKEPTIGEGARRLLEAIESLGGSPAEYSDLKALVGAPELNRIIEVTSKDGGTWDNVDEKAKAKVAQGPQTKPGQEQGGLL